MNDFQSERIMTGGDLPRRTPMETIAAHGAPPEPPRDRFSPPGRAPWADDPPRRGMPPWAWVAIVLGGLFIMCASSVWVTALTEAGPVTPAPSISLAAVEVSGVCEKNLIGEYSLVATVTAVNTTDTPQTGNIWVRWPVTGADAAEFVHPVTIPPGAAQEFPVSHPVRAEEWFRTGTCAYGWAPGS